MLESCKDRGDRQRDGRGECVCKASDEGGAGLDDVNHINSHIPIKFPTSILLFKLPHSLDQLLINSPSTWPLPVPKMYFVESTHHSHTDNTGLSITDERYKPTSKQKNAVSRCD